ncbi:MAG: hypothetical protein J0L92_20660 [Deltaproteobacteria bacterium]|nr:hypothetical protein [Deltaproteobacteria bacterium]
MRARPLTLVPFLFVGCSNPGCACAPSTEAPATSATSGTEAMPPADYEVHEWGLLRAQRDGSADVLRAGAIAPARPVEVMAVDKPVLYFHSSQPRTLRLVSAAVEGGTILESWPFVEAHARSGGAEIAWTDVRLGSPAECEPSPLPTQGTLPCSLLAGAYCESIGLATVRTTEAACVTTGGVTDRFLFYRAQSHTFTPPLRFARAEIHEDVRVTNDGDHPIPGVIVRIWSDGTRTRTLVAGPPAPHESVVIGHAFDEAVAGAGADRPVAVDRLSMDESLPAPSVTGPGRDGIRRTMREIGLTDAEADAFFAAWDATLFGGANADAGAVTNSPADVLTDDSRGGDGERAPRESLLYFLPEPSTDRVATLRFDPPPRAVHRALAIWTAIRASGEGH